MLANLLMRVTGAARWPLATRQWHPTRRSMFDVYSQQCQWQFEISRVLLREI
jgi:hypothetical protein